MKGDDYMPKFDFSKDSHKLTGVEKAFVERMEAQNLVRAQKLIKSRNKNRFIGIVLGLGVVSIYGYTMFAIKQESFLDDFNEPEKIEG